MCPAQAGRISGVGDGSLGNVARYGMGLASHSNSRRFGSVALSRQTFGNPMIERHIFIIIYQTNKLLGKLAAMQFDRWRIYGIVRKK